MNGRSKESEKLLQAILFACSTAYQAKFIYIKKRESTFSVCSVRPTVDVEAAEKSLTRKNLT